MGNTARASGSKPNHAPATGSGGFTSSQSDNAACKPPATGSSNGRVRSPRHANAMAAKSNGPAMRAISFTRFGNSEGRNPKTECIPHTADFQGEFPRPGNRYNLPDSDFGFRPSFGFRISAFGFSSSFPQGGQFVRVQRIEFFLNPVHDDANDKHRHGEVQ